MHSHPLVGVSMESHLSAACSPSAKLVSLLPDRMKFARVRLRTLWSVRVLIEFAFPVGRIDSNNCCPPALGERFRARLVYSQLVASDGSRTRDRQVMGLMLYQLSYFNRCRF